MNAPLRVHNIQTLLGQVVVPSVAFGVAVLATFWSPLVVFNVTVSTERLELAIEDESGINWSFRDARLADTFGKPFPFSGSLHLAGPAFIVVRRVGLGPVVIDVESHGDSVGILYPSDDDERLPQDMGPRKAGFLLSIELGDLPRRAADGETMVLPFVGKAEVGRAIGYESGGFPGILRGGKVALLSGTLLSDGVYEAGSAILDSGDHIAFPGATTLADGFALADERSALTVAFRTKGQKAMITRPGGQTYAVQAPIRDRILRDPAVQGV